MMAALGGVIQRGRAVEVTRVDWRAARQQEIEHFEMAGARGMAERPGADPVAGVDRCALIEQLGREVSAIAVGRGEQRQRHFNRRDLGLADFEPAAQFPAAFRLRGIGRRDGAERDKERRTQEHGMAMQGGLSRWAAFIEAADAVRMTWRGSFAKKAVCSRAIRPFNVSYRQARFAARGMARKVMVAGANVLTPASAGSPCIEGSRSPVPSFSARPFNLTSVALNSAASSV